MSKIPGLHIRIAGRWPYLIEFLACRLFSGESRSLTITTRVVYIGRVSSRTTPLPGGELEYAVLASLWRLGTATARDLHRLVGEPQGLVYTTIAKVLDRLTAKGLVARKRTGKAFVYRARIEQSVIELARARVALKGLLGSAPQPPMATLVEAVESLDPQLLDELEKAVAARRRSQH